MVQRLASSTLAVSRLMLVMTYWCYDNIAVCVDIAQHSGYESVRREILRAVRGVDTRSSAVQLSRGGRRDVSLRSQELRFDAVGDRYRISGECVTNTGELSRQFPVPTAEGTTCVILTARDQRVTISPAMTELRFFISRRFRYYSPSFHSRQFLFYLTYKCLWMSSHWLVQLFSPYKSPPFHTVRPFPFASPRYHIKF